MGSRSTAATTRPGQQLQDRLIAFAVEVWQIGRGLSDNPVTVRTVDQLVRAATSVAANYAEACAAESRRDFVHKMQICLKELRETAVWLELLQRVGQSGSARDLEAECDQLIRIFVASIRTARQRT